MLQEPVIEKFVGHKMKERRKLLKLSQMQLAELMGLSYQQIQKYESGANKFSLNRIIQLSKVLNVNPNYFYDGAIINDNIGDEHQSEIIKNIRTRPLNVLLIEDNVSDVMLFQNALEVCDHKFDLHIIKDAQTVIDYLNNHDSKYGNARPDLIILDINLPKIDGLTLLKQIKRNQVMADIPIVMLTNSVNKSDMNEAYKFNASGFIQKAAQYDDYCKIWDMIPSK